MEYTLYRAVRRKEPRRTDFWSDFAHGEDPFRGQLLEPLMWAGISVSDDFENAKRRAIELNQGNFLAVLHIDDTRDSVIVKQTPTKRDPHHHSVMGVPATLRALVIEVKDIA
jgi:hypothetical protein